MNTIAKWKTQAHSEFLFIFSSYLGFTVYIRGFEYENRWYEQALQEANEENRGRQLGFFDSLVFSLSSSLIDLAQKLQDAKNEIERKHFTLFSNRSSINHHTRIEETTVRRFTHVREHRDSCRFVFLFSVSESF